MRDLMHKVSVERARHNWPSFLEYFEEWKKLKAKQKKSGNKKQDMIQVPNKPPMTEKQRIEYNRTFGLGYLTPTSETWLKTWQPQRRLNEADFNDNRYSILRRQTSRLYFIVKDTKSGKWKFPDVVRANPLSMRFAAQLRFQQDMNRRVLAYFIAHTPIGHYENPQNSNERTFFFHCLYISGRPPFKKMENEWSDHAWVTRQELLEYEFADDQYKRAIYNMLYDGYQIYGNEDA